MKAPSPNRQTAREFPWLLLKTSLRAFAHAITSARMPFLHSLLDYPSFSSFFQEPFPGFQSKESYFLLSSLFFSCIIMGQRLTVTGFWVELFNVGLTSLVCRVPQGQGLRGFLVCLFVCGTWDLSSPTRDRTHSPCRGSAES